MFEKLQLKSKHSVLIELVYLVCHSAKAIIFSQTLLWDKYVKKLW